MATDQEINDCLAKYLAGALEREGLPLVGRYTFTIKGSIAISVSADGKNKLYWLESEYETRQIDTDKRV
jgi:hypothetical protein